MYLILHQFRTNQGMSAFCEICLQICRVNNFVEIVDRSPKKIVNRDDILFRYNRDKINFKTNKNPDEKYTLLEFHKLKV